MLLRRLLVVVAVLASAACAPTGGPAPVIEVDAPTALVDQPLHVRVTGLGAGERVNLELAGRDAGGVEWRSSGTWEADAGGVVDLRAAAPLAGSYAGVDGMGLFWSMTPPPDSPAPAVLVPPGTDASLRLEITARAGGREPARRELVQRWRAEGVTTRPLTVAADGVAGVLLLPPAGAPANPPVLVIGGSDGEPLVPIAALLAARGFPALALDYFGGDGLPTALRRVPIEQMATAADVLRRAAGAPTVAVMGYSRGSEAALLLAHHRPDLVRAAVLCAPNDRVIAAYPPPGDAWTLGGEPVPGGPIPVAGIAGPVMTVSGGRDRLWNAAAQAGRLGNALAAAGVPHEALRYPDAGHGVGLTPQLAVRADGPEAATRVADAAARADGWPRMLEFLASS